MQQRFYTALILFLVLFCTALLAYSGRVLGVDGRASLATSATLAHEGRWDMNILSSQYWTSRGAGGQVVVNGAGDSYSKKAPLVALVHAPLMWVGYQLPVLGAIQLTLLTIPLIYAATGVLLYFTCKRLNFTDEWSFVSVAVWSVGTFALANTKEVFAEPIMAFGAMLAIYALVPQKPSQRNALLCGVGAALIVGGNLASGLLVPLVWLGLIYPKTTLRRLIIKTALFALPLIIMGLLVAYLNWVRSESILSSGYRFSAGEGFSTPLWVGLWGMILGGYRGLLWYAPITLLAPLALLFGNHRRMTLTAMGLIATQLVTFSMWWAWYGGGGYGARFLVPVLPLMVLLAMSSIRWLWQTHIIGRIICIALFIYSGVIQLAGVLVHFSAYEGLLYQQIALEEADRQRWFAFLPPQQSPLFYHMQNLGSGDWTAWSMETLWLPICLLIAIAIMCYLLTQKELRTWHIALAMTFAVLGSVASVSVATERYQWDTTEALAPFFSQQRRPSDVAFINDRTGWALVNAPSRPPVYSMPPDVTADDTYAQDIVTKLTTDYERIWFTTRQPTANWVEAPLWSAYSVGSNQFVDDYRVVLFDSHTLDVQQYERVNLVFDTLTLTHYASERRNENVYLGLQWEGRYPPDSTMFVHLLDANGMILQQHDRLPLNGIINAENDPITDQHVFPLQASDSPAQIRVGWVASDGTPIPVGNEDFILLPIGE